MKLLDRSLRSLTARRARPMSRDKADTLLLLLACTMVLAPQAMELPVWVTAFSTVLLLWRGWITFRGNRMPPRWILLPIAACAMAGIYFTFKTFFGMSAGVAMLVLLLTFKLLEMRAARDLFVVVFLSFFLMLTNFFNSQSILTALITVATVIVMLTAQLSFQYTNAAPSLWKRLCTGAMIFGLAAPVTIALFVLFPRVQGPLWGLPSDANIGRSGLSDSMAPGNIAKLALSNDVAFRVKFQDAVPPSSQRYWRAIVLGQYDGRSWKRVPRTQSNSENAVLLSRGSDIRYQITQEPSSQPWMFSLEMATNTPPQLIDRTARFTNLQELIASRPIDERIRYDLTSHADYSFLQKEASESMRPWLMLPSGFNPKALAFADQIAQRSPNAADAVNAVLTFFRTEQFSYTLQPPLLGRDGIDEFLFSTHAGFCEHYAGAFVFLMRAMHIPARVVTGYQGGEINPVDGYLTVRQSDAHAWAEVWIAQRGWVRVDPTAAIAPERINRDESATAATPAFGGLFNVGNTSLLARLRFRWDAVNNGWNQWILNYTPQRQKSLLESLGFDNIDWQTMIMLAVAVGSLIMLLVTMPLFFNRPKRDPIDLLYEKMCGNLARRGMPRQPHEGPRGYCRRLLKLPSLTQEQKNALRQFMLLYEASRYGVVEHSARAKLIPRLRNLLNQCR